MLHNSLGGQVGVLLVKTYSPCVIVNQLMMAFPLPREREQDLPRTYQETLLFFMEARLCSRSGLGCEEERPSGAAHALVHEPYASRRTHPMGLAAIVPTALMGAR